MSLEDRQADACGLIEEVINVAQEPRKSEIQQRFTQLNDAFSEAYQLDDEDEDGDGDRAYDAVEALEEFAEELREEFEEQL
jgi:hypothetical protein